MCYMRGNLLNLPAGKMCVLAGPCVAHCWVWLIAYGSHITHSGHSVYVSDAIWCITLAIWF